MGLPYENAGNFFAFFVDHGDIALPGRAGALLLELIGKTHGVSECIVDRIEHLANIVCEQTGAAAQLKEVAQIEETPRNPYAL